jgi:hypothetical protein
MYAYSFGSGSFLVLDRLVVSFPNQSEPVTKFSLDNGRCVGLPQFLSNLKHRDTYCAANGGGTYNSVGLETVVLFLASSCLQLIKPGDQGGCPAFGIGCFMSSHSNQATNSLGDARLFEDDKVLDVSRLGDMTAIED